MPYIHMPKAPWKSDNIRAKGNPTARAPKSIILSDVNDKEPRRLVETSAGVVDFYHGMAQLPNDARGREIVAEYKEAKALVNDDRSIAVAEGRPTRWNDPVHNYFFGSWPEMPWKREDAQYR